MKNLQEGQGAFDGIKLACLLDMKKYRRRLCLLMLKEAQKMGAEDLKTEEDKETGQCWKMQRSGQIRSESERQLGLERHFMLDSYMFKKNP